MLVSDAIDANSAALGNNRATWYSPVWQRFVLYHLITSLEMVLRPFETHNNMFIIG